MKPFFSIIVPVYQTEHTLMRCVQSVLSQKFTDYEIILVDDGSPDNSGVICDSLAETDNRIHVVHQKNSGVSAARNAGIRIAQGSYLLFLDSDDALFPLALSRYAEATEQGTMDMVIAGLSVWENEKAIRKIGLDVELHAGNEIWEQICRNPEPFGYAGGKLVRRSIVSDNTVVFNLCMNSQEDLDFFLSVYGFCDTFHVILDCLYMYYYAASTRTPPIGDHLANQIKLFRTANTRTDLSSIGRNAVHSRVLKMLYTGLYCAVENARYTEVLENLLEVDGLRELIEAEPTKGEHGFVARNFVAGRYQFIKLYFIFRRVIRDMVRCIKKR